MSKKKKHIRIQNTGNNMRSSLQGLKKTFRISAKAYKLT